LRSNASNSYKQSELVAEEHLAFGTSGTQKTVFAALGATLGAAVWFGTATAQQTSAQPKASTTSASPMANPGADQTASLPKQLTPDSLQLPIDTGVNGLKLEIRKLRTTARLMQVVAHPDDEDGGMLTLEARGHGVETELFTITRGEGGQNRLGSGLFDELGQLRTLELMASDHQYGVTPRFSHAADFGFSKTPEESFQKWGGRDTVLADLVREIRTFRPDVLVARFSGTPLDGHGHHQASALLTKEAFRAASDPKRFPEQLKQGLQPWQPKKLYVGAFGPNYTQDVADYSVEIDKSVEDPLLGTDYQHFALNGLRHQLSQGAGMWNIPPGRRYTSKYRLVDHVAEVSAINAKEKDFFDGIDTSLAGLFERLGPADQGRIPDFRSKLQKIESKIEDASRATDTDRESATIALLEARDIIREIQQQLTDANLSSASSVRPALNLKQQQLEKAAALAAGIDIDAQYVDGSTVQTAGLVTPGEKIKVTMKVTHDPKVQVRIAHFQLSAPSNWPVGRLVPSDAADVVEYDVKIPHGAEYTRPYYHRNDPNKENVYTIDDPKLAGLPATPTPFYARLNYEVGREAGEVTVPVVSKYENSGVATQRAVAVAPVASVLIEPHTRVLPESQREPMEVHVNVRSDVAKITDGTIRLRVPSGWKVEPERQPVNLESKGSEHTFKFYLFRLDPAQKSAEIRAVLDYNGDALSQGFSVVTREDLRTAYYYQPAIEHINVVDVKVPESLAVGYIMGAGDDIPAVLRDAGVDVRIITPEELASADLMRYSTIVLGIRAYDVREDVRKNNPRLLAYVENGGTLIVQYNADVQQFNGGKFTPYPTTLTRDRVTMEDAPVKILENDDEIFDTPNEISAADFSGWVQERGLYFMKDWDPRYTALLESHDTGDSEMKGGLLKTTYGKGTYIYCGYAFFRQLPSGVPGAVRLFVNLLTAPAMSSPASRQFVIAPKGKRKK
jgi:LmbE family N-acetylglucosaminyl deacetylase